MDDIDRKIKGIWKKVIRPEQVTKREKCPADEMLLQYIGGALSESGKEEMEHHLHECYHCLDLIHLYKRVTEDEAEENLSDVPESWEVRARKLVSSRGTKNGEKLIDVVLRITKETIEVIRNPGNLAVSYDTAPVPVRGGEKDRSPHVITLNKIFYSEMTEMEVEPGRHDLVNMKVITRKIDSGLPSEGIRVSLCNPRRELASYVAKNGEAYFKDLTIGEYVVKIAMSGNTIGQISLIING